MILIPIVLVSCALPQMPDQKSKILRSWDFDIDENWTFGNEIIEPRVDNGILEFTADGTDPILYGPEYEPLQANNRQAIEIRLKANSSGTWELFYADTNEGPFGGYRQDRSLRFYVPAKTDWQVIRVFPFWKAVGKTIKIRLDPPCGRFKIDWIRIVEIGHQDDYVLWKGNKWFVDQRVGAIQDQGKWLEMTAKESPCMFLCFKDIDSESSHFLYMQFKSCSLEYINFCWANDLSIGLHSAGIKVTPDGQLHTVNLDLLEFPEWRGKIDVVGFLFGDKANDELALANFDVTDRAQGEPNIELYKAIIQPTIRRQGSEMTLSVYLRNTGAKRYEGGTASVIQSEDISVVGDSTLMVPPIGFNEMVNLTWKLIPKKSGNIPVKINVAGKFTLSTIVRVEPRIEVVNTNYVPKPVPVNTYPYEIGVYYFPGWSPDQLDRWKKQLGFPERDPALGFYREGDPEVADWHIKWAVENGIKFFVYDWYWRDGRVALEKALEDGYLRARYRDYLKFCIMWANHAPFANHSLEQLLTVTDYWTERYFHLDSYYKIDGKPVVLFFAPDNLTHDLGGSEKVKEAFEMMRQRAKEKGLLGIYFIACGDNSPNGQKRFKEEGYDAISAYNYPYAGAGPSLWASYEKLMEAHIQIWNNSLSADILTYIPVLTVGWDSRPWHGNKALVRYGRSTERFKAGLQYLKEWMNKNNRYIALLEAWNEWGEGSYIEPNSEFGFGDLEAIRDVFAEPGTINQNLGPSDVGLGGYSIIKPEHQD